MFLILSILTSFSLLPVPCFAVVVSKNSFHLRLACKSLISSCITRARSVTESTPLCWLSVHVRNRGIHHSSGRSSLQLLCISCNLRAPIYQPCWGQQQQLHELSQVYLSAGSIHFPTDPRQLHGPLCRR